MSLLGRSAASRTLCGLLLGAPLLASCSNGPAPPASRGPAAAAEQEPGPDPRRVAADLCDQAQAALLADDPAGALDDLQLAASLDPGAARISWLRGTALQRLGRPAEAHPAFTRALALEPEQRDPALLLRATQAMLDAGAPAEALTVVARATPPSGELLVLAARARSTLEDVPGAIADLERALALSPPPQDAAELLAGLRARSDQLRSQYVPAADPERLGEATLALADRAHLRLPLGFSSGGSVSAPRGRRGNVVMRLSSRADPGGELAAWTQALLQQAAARGARVVRSCAVHVAGLEAVALHEVESGPTSGMFAPFDVVTYRWVVRGGLAPVEVVMETEVARGVEDVAPALRQDVLAALATLEVER